MSNISITHTPAYELDALVADVRTHFKRFSLHEKLHAGSRVLLKPNLLMKRKPEEFTTTHPLVVEAVAVCLKEIGVTDITLADSPGGPYTVSALKDIYRVCGMSGVAERQGIMLNEDVSSQEAVNPDGKLVKSFPIITPVAEADFIIDIAKLKTHAMTGMSAAVKNLFGCVPGLTKPEFHWRFPDKRMFADMLLDLAETVRADFAIVDAVDSMEGDGPSAGTRRHTGRLFASDHLYDLDDYLCSYIGAEPETIFTVSHAAERGLSCGDRSGIQVLGESGEPEQPFQTPHDKGVDFVTHLPKALQGVSGFFVKRFFTSKPVIRRKECIGCAKCAESCPAKVIKIQEKKAVIDYAGCIHCFCCHEMCPVKAIDIKRSRLFRI